MPHNNSLSEKSPRKTLKKSLTFSISFAVLLKTRPEYQQSKKYLEKILLLIHFYRRSSTAEKREAVHESQHSWDKIQNIYSCSSSGRHRNKRPHFTLLPNGKMLCSELSCGCPNCCTNGEDPES